MPAETSFEIEEDTFSWTLKTTLAVSITLLIFLFPSDDPQDNPKGEKGPNKKEKE